MRFGAIHLLNHNDNTKRMLLEPLPRELAKVTQDPAVLDIDNPTSVMMEELPNDQVVLITNTNAPDLTEVSRKLEGHPLRGLAQARVNACQEAVDAARAKGQLNIIA